MDTKNKIARSAGIVSVIAMIGKVIGYLCNIVIAALFGASALTDAYVIGFTIPRFFLNVLGGGSLNAAFVPVFKTYMGNDEKREAWDLAIDVLNIIFIIVAFLSIIGILVAPLLVSLFAPGFEKDTALLATKITRIIFPSLIFFCLASIVKAILQAQHRFAIPSLTPIALNLSIVLSAFFLSRYIGVISLAVGVVLGGIAQLSIQWPLLVRVGMRYRFSIRYHPGIKKILLLFIPLLGGVVVSRLNRLVARILASLLEEGSVAALNFADLISQIPVTIFGISLATVVFPNLVEKAVGEDLARFKNTFLKSLRMIFFIALPISIGMIILRMPLIKILFERGEFTHQDTIMTATALMYFAIGSVALASVHILLRGFYALKDTKTPVVIGVIALVGNIIFNLILIRFMGLGGLALGTSLAAILRVLLLTSSLNKRLNGMNIRYLFSGLSRILLCSLIMGCICYVLYNSTGILFKSTTFLNNVIQLSIITLLCIISYLGLCKAFRVEEVGYFIQLVRSKIGKKIG